MALEHLSKFVNEKVETSAVPWLLNIGYNIGDLVLAEQVAVL